MEQFLPSCMLLEIIMEPITSLPIEIIYVIFLRLNNNACSLARRFELGGSES